MRPSAVPQGKTNTIDKDICFKMTVTSERFSAQDVHTLYFQKNRIMFFWENFMHSLLFLFL